MAFQNKCEVYIGDNEIVIADNSGYYSTNNPTGWSHPLMGGGSPVTSTVIDSNLVGTIESIVLVIDTITFEIASGSYENVLPVALEYIASPKDLVFTINKDTYPTFYVDFAEFTDGVHTLSYTITFTQASGFSSVTYTTSFFTYKEVETMMWQLFHTIAYNHNNGGNKQVFINKSLYALALFKGLEYSARTSTSTDKSLEILSTLNKVLDFNNSLSY